MRSSTAWKGGLPGPRPQLHRGQADGRPAAAEDLPGSGRALGDGPRPGPSPGDDARPVLFSALFNMHKVHRHVLERDGATYRSREADFLVSDVTDFHPTDVLEDAEGSLLVVDTGGWFRH